MGAWPAGPKPGQKPGQPGTGRLSAYVRIVGLVAMAAVTSSIPVQASAQTSGRGDTVLDRARPEFDPVGLRLGTIWVFPAYEIGILHDDNIFASRRNTVDDIIIEQSPRIAVKSDFPRHALGLDVGADLGRYVDRGTEDYDDLHVAANGRLDIQRGSEVSATVQWDRLHDDRSSPDDVGGLEPTIYRRSDAGLGYRQEFNRVELRVGGLVRHYDFDDASTGAAIVNNDDRDRMQYRLESRLQYALVDAFRAFVEGAATRVDYASARDDNGFDRNSQGGELYLGVGGDLTGVILGEVMVGRVIRRPDEPRFADISEPAIRARLTWNVTRLTSVRGEIARDIEETAVNGASAIVATTASLRVDHELLRNVIVHAGASHRDHDFVGIGREDELLAWNLGARYLVNRTMSLGLDYDGLERDSSQANADFTRNRVMLRLRLQM